MKIGRKLILSFLVVIVIPMSILAVVTTHMINTSMEEDAQKAIHQNLKTARIQYFVRGDQMKFGMLQAAAEPEIKRAVAERDKEYLKELMSAWKEYRPYIDMWVIVDSKAIVIARYNNDYSGDFLPLNGAVAKAVATKKAVISTEIVSKEVLQRESEELANRVVYLSSEKSGGDGIMLTVVTPVVKGDDVLGAVITGDLLNKDYFVPDSLEKKIPGLIVSIAQGEVVVSTNIKDEDGSRTLGAALPEEVMTKIISGKSFGGDVFVSSGDYKIAVEPLKDNNGKTIGALFVGVPKTQFIALQSSNAKAVALVTMLGILIALSLASIATNEISKPVTELVKASRKIRRGDFDVRIAGKRMESNDEIGELAQSFNLMTKRLKKSHQGLEQRIDERTKELLLLQKINNMLNAGAGMAEILRSIVEGLTSIFNYDVSAVHLLNEERTHLICKNYSADSETVKRLEKLAGARALNYEIPLYKGSMLLKLIETKAPMLTTDMVAIVKSHTNNKSIQAMAKSIARISGINSGIGVPLLAGDKIVGIIGIGSKGQLSNKDVERLGNFAKQAGLAVEKAKMYTVMEEKIQERTKELKESKDFLDSMFDSITDVIYIRDPEYKIMKANKVALEIFGEGLVDELCYEQIGGNTEPCKDCPVEHAMKTKNVVTREVYDERLKEYLLFSTYPQVDENGVLKAVVGTIKLVTERKKLEQHLSRSEKLASIGRLSAGVAHEINNPLTNISIYSQLLLKKTRGENKRMMGIIKSQADIAARIVKNLLEFSRQHVVKFEQTDINHLISAVLIISEHQFSSKNIKVVKDLDSNSPKILADDSQLQQVFVNIMTNAIEAMPRGGNLTVSTRKANGFIEVKISDTGRGIPKEDLPKIFDPFFTTKEIGKGTGLGLSISYGIIKKHDGKISVESEVGKGTTFIIELPMSGAL